MVHLCAPTTYAKQDKQQCDSNIYDFKHEGYHKVKCISKSSGIEITEARGDDDVLPSSSQWSTSRWRGVGDTQRHQWPLPNLRWRGAVEVVFSNATTGLNLRWVA